MKCDICGNTITKKEQKDAAKIDNYPDAFGPYREVQHGQRYTFRHKECDEFVFDVFHRED